MVRSFSENQTISVIVRSSDPRRLPLLDQALFSLASQDWPHLEVLIMLQNPNDQFLEDANSLVARIAWGSGMSASVHPVSIDHGVDGRAILLNEGIAISNGRYVAFLDDDDIVYPRGYTFLIEVLERNTRSALAAGRCRMSEIAIDGAEIHVIRKYPSNFGQGQTRYDLLEENFIPIHSYIIDRARLSSPLPSFETKAVPLEDYDFLLNLAHVADFAIENRKEYVCEYRLHGSNSIWAAHMEPDRLPPALRRAREFLAERKAAIELPLARADLEKLRRRFLGADNVGLASEVAGMQSSDGSFRLPTFGRARNDLSGLPRGARLFAMIGLAIDYVTSPSTYRRLLRGR